MSDLLIGVGITTSAAAGDDPLAEALAAERAGYDFVSASDHPVGTHPSYETLALLTWIAARTTRIGVATRVLGVPFRRPAMIAKSAESLHRLSGGRLILGLGAGHSDAEIAALGGAAMTPGRKVAGLADALTVLRTVWGDPRDAAVDAAPGLTLTPRPATPIPIWLGTYGPRALAVTGRLADGWIPSLGFAPPERIPSMLDRIREAALAAGRPADAVRPVYNVAVHLGRGAVDIDDGGTVHGSAAGVVAQLLAWRELGFRGYNLMPAPGQEQAVAEEVLPGLRQAGA